MLLEDTYTLRDTGGLVREIVRKRTFEADPRLSYSRTQQESIHYMRPQVSIVFPYYESIAEKLVVGQCKTMFSS
jgi:hypothetical protein